MTFPTDRTAHNAKTTQEKLPIMKKLKGFRRLATAGILAASAFTTTAVTTAVVGVGSASAASSCASGSATSPQWINCNVESDRSAGSDTTYYVMTKIGNLYNQAALFGCTLESNEATCDDAPVAPFNATNDPDNPATTDYGDNYDRNEEVTGVDQVGSGAGQAQLCDNNQGSNNAATPLPVDYARSSSGISSSQDSTCIAAEKEDFFAADAVDLLDFYVNPSVYGTATSTVTNYNYAAVNSGSIGDVANGWIPPADIPSAELADGTESITCDASKTGANGQFGNGTNNCAGYPFSDVDNTPETLASGGDGGGSGASSVAYEIWCSGTITDWGQLTNVGPFTAGVPSVAVGSGTPIGLHINLIGVNPSSGTNGVWTKFAQSGQSACNSNANETVIGSDTHLALENNTAQIDDFATTDFPSDLPDQAVELATALYYVANGIYNASPYQSSVALTTSGVKNNPTLKAFPGQLVGLNTQFPSETNIFNQTFPTARELGNIYLSTALTGVANSGIRASTAAFLDWICDDNNQIQKGKDLTNGLNYDTEVTNLINTSYGFIRLDDSSPSPNNNACPMITSVVFPNS